MLAFLRRKQKGLKWILWLVILGLGAGMVLLFVGTPGDLSSSGLAQSDVAQVGERPISAIEFRKQYRRMYEMYRQVYKLDQQDPEIVKQLGLGQQALNSLISEYAVTEQARKMGLDATPEEIRQEIMRMPVFQNKGAFVGTELYQQILRQNDMTAQEFEENLRRDIIRQKMQQLLTDGIIVTPEEVRQEYENRNLEAKVRYIAIDKKASEPTTVDEAELKKFYESRKEAYRKGEQRRVNYVFVPADPMSVKVSEEAVQARINTINPEEQVRAAHILIKTPPGGDDAEARKKAEAVLARINAGEDFASVAKAVSEDPGSAQQGGDLGFFGRGQMVPEFEQAAFSLQPGQTSGLVKSPFGFHIIRVLDKTTTQPESQRAVVEFELRQAEAIRAARDQAYKIINAARQKPLAEVAKEHKLSAMTSDYFGIADPVPGMVVRSDFNEKIFGLKKGDLASPYQGSGGFYVAQVADIKPPETPPFEEVRTRVENDYKTRRGDELARQKATEFLNAAKGQDFDTVAKKAGYKVTTTSYFKKGSNIDDTLRFSPELHDRVFTKIAEGEVTGPIEIAGKFVVVQLIDKTDVDQAKFEQEKAQIEKDLTAQKRAEFFSTYVRNLVEEMRKGNQIVVNQQLLDDLIG
ncbi:MAG TPA: peptidylprolyl isomerase [Acidobacteriota bacterium]|nr:peptidylprolyl isomerase [Acidobacteriota bacterium]